MATVTEAIKEKVLGTELEPQLSAQTRNKFVDAIAPEGEDYVSNCRCWSEAMLSARQYKPSVAH
jgi:hypothetical protein